MYSEEKWSEIIRISRRKGEKYNELILELTEVGFGRQMQENKKEFSVAVTEMTIEIDRNI